MWLLREKKGEGGGLGYIFHRERGLTSVHCAPVPSLCLLKGLLQITGHFENQENENQLGEKSVQAITRLSPWSHPSASS